MDRKIIQISSTESAIDALCNDGTVWTMSLSQGEWRKVEDIQLDYRCVNQQLESLIAELEGLEMHTFNSGLLFDSNMKKFVNYDELKALIDKYKGGE